MGPSEKIVWRLYIGTVGVVTTIVAHNIISKVWETVTGNSPPSATDPDTPASTAFTWALASGVGAGMAQLLARRMVTRHWRDRAGESATDGGKIIVAI